MPFREVRDLAEHLKLLGYPHTFPLQSLSSNGGCLASFYVVAEILQWLAGLMEPGVVLTGSVNSPEDRVLLIRSATEFFVTKSAVKLNPRKLYAASAITVGELQKITSLLITPSGGFTKADEDGQDDAVIQVDIGDKMDDLRKAREISSELTQKAKTLNELLLKESQNKEVRLNQVSRPLELSAVERCLKNAVASAQLKLKSSRAQLESARLELNALNSKLLRKRSELERNKQRLQALQKIRPAHMQEFEECEKELKLLFQQYFRRLHVRDALKAQLEGRTKKATLISSPTVLQKPAENSIPFIPEGLLLDDEEDDEDDEAQLDAPTILQNDETDDIKGKDVQGDQVKLSDIKRPSTATRRARPPLNRISKGSTTATIRRERDDDNNKKNVNKNILDDDSSFGSSDSDLDMAELLAGAAAGDTITAAAGNIIHLPDEDDDDFDLNSMESISISKITGELPLRPKTAAKPEHHSDEDF